MDWMEVRLTTLPERLETLTARLVAEGFESFQVEDRADFQVFLQERPQWEEVDASLMAQFDEKSRVTLYLADDARLSADLERLFALCVDEDTLETRRVSDETWAENWKAYYKPVPVGEKLLILPAWETLDNPEGRVVFKNQPGLCFGTGEHETTRLCLEALERHIRPGMQVLDIGSGSGILFICALLLGAKSAVAVDIDPQAAVVARENAADNGVLARATIRAGNLLEEEEVEGTPFDLVCSNIVADIVSALSPKVWRFLVPGGRWLVSGVISAYREQFLTAAEKMGFSLEEETHKNDWYCFVCRKPEQ